MKNIVLQQYFKLLGYDARPEFLNQYLKVPSLKRLQKIGYFCGMDYASKEIYQFKERITRYDHSLTVALLTWHYTKDKRATLAGLFHDIATPCFSHVIDYMNKDYENQESTEEYTEKILQKDSYLKECLKQDKIAIEEVTNFKKYSIVDNNRPRLCADRLDGVILTGLYWTKSIAIEEIEKVIKDIQIYSNEEGKEEIGFASKEIANLVLKVSEEIDRYCHSNEDNYMMELLASITREAIKNNIISYDDLYRINEEELMNKLEKCQNKKINQKLTKFKTISKEEIPTIKLDNVKPRELNPLVKGIRLK